jgi:hypothetical protein
MRVDVAFISVMSSMCVFSLRFYVDTLYTLYTTGNRTRTLFLFAIHLHFVFQFLLLYHLRSHGVRQR